MMARRAGAVAVLAAVVALGAGCSAADDGRQGSAAAPAAKAPAAAAAPSAAPTAQAPAGGTAANGAASAAPVADNRLIAYTAQLSLRTKDVGQLLAKAREMAGSAGGYVGGESIAGGGDGDAGGQLTLRVPSAAFQQTLDQLAGLGEVVSRKSQADDLTQQVADVASRVQSQQASVERVRALMAQAKSLSEVTALEAELSRRESDLESLQKQQKELAGKTSLSTITLEVHREVPPAPAPPPAPKVEAKGFWASAGSALAGGWHVLLTILRGLVVALAAVAPFLLVLGVPAAVAYWWWRRYRMPAAVAAPGPTGDEQD
ncbi:DUF4349 domain-containing protein [Kitasatospora sp. NPDC059722]|uniref:DUF4349 domain-containing protein n=1 Tax=Kitasatospora sp. NPDC059722 TaxID=3346925 RepID=UPI00369313F5